MATAPHARWPVWGRTGLDAAPSPDPARSPRSGLARDNRCEEPPGRMHTRSAGSGYCRACGGGRGLLPQARAARLARQPLGKPLTPEGPRRHWLPVQVTEGLAVPGPVLMSWSPAGVTVRPARWLPVPVSGAPLGAALLRQPTRGRDSRGWRSRGCGLRGWSRRRGPADGGEAAGRVASPEGARSGCRNHRRPGGTGCRCRQRPAHAAAHGAPDSSLQGSALAPYHGARTREQDWGVP